MKEYEDLCEELTQLAESLADANYHQESSIIKDIVKEVRNSDIDPTARILKMLLARDYD